ncbi:hypothetical protein ACFE04_013507 [Oxalis oulophora]
MATKTLNLNLSRCLCVCLFMFILFTSNTKAESFKCTVNTTCSSLVGYVSPNKTTLSSIQTLFNVKKLNSLLGANNLPLSTLKNTTISRQETINVPIPCICVNNTGVSNKIPIYTVISGDILWHIANEVFGGLVTVAKIQEVNKKIVNSSLIEIGDQFWIPLPCSCDQVVKDEKVIHYGYLVEEGDSLSKIGTEFGVDQDTIKSINDVANDTQLIAGHVLDIPLKACSSYISSDSEDYGLLVSNGTYAVTANQCIKCQCSSNDWILDCESSGLKPSNWTQCPSTKCSDTLSLSNSTTTGCDLTTCSYTGYSSANQTISTSLESTSTCPAPAPSNSDTSRISLNLIFSVHMVLVFLFFLL